MQRPRIWGLWHMRQLTPKELDLGWNVSSEKYEEPCALAVNTVLALLTWTGFPFLSCQSGTRHGYPLLYIHFKGEGHAISSHWAPGLNHQSCSYYFAFTICSSLCIKGGVQSSSCLADTPSSPLPLNPPLLFPSFSWPWGTWVQWHIGGQAVK